MSGVTPEKAVKESLQQKMEQALRSQLVNVEDPEGYGLKIDSSLNYPDPPELAPELINQVMRRGQKLLFTGPAGSGKTSALMAISLALVHGKEWLGMQMQSSSVLYVNMTVSKKTFINRFHRVAEKMGLDPVSKKLSFLHHSGGTMEPTQFCKELKELLINAKLEDGTDYQVVVLDPGYKLVGGGGSDEESNFRAASLLTGLGKLSQEGTISFLIAMDAPNVPPHYQIGSEKENGLAQLARDCDALLTLWPLEGVRNGFRLKAELKEFESFKPFAVSFDFPLFDKSPEFEKIPQVGAYMQQGWQSGSAPSETTAQSADEPKNLWKVFESIAENQSVTMALFAENLGVNEFELRRRVLHLGPHPSNPNLRLRMSVDGRIVAEED